MCGRDFSPGNFNTWTAVVCPKCRPEYRLINQRIRRAQKRLKRLEAEKAAAENLLRTELDKWSAIKVGKFAVQLASHG
jgi:hypothetical protein